MKTKKTSPVRNRTTSPLLARLANYINNDGGDAHALMTAIDDLDGVAALATLENELRSPSARLDDLQVELEVLTAIYESVSCMELFASAHDYPGRDIVTAWHFHGARTADFLREIFEENATRRPSSRGRYEPPAGRDGNAARNALATTP